MTESLIGVVISVLSAIAAAFGAYYGFRERMAAALASRPERAEINGMMAHIETVMKSTVTEARVQLSKEMDSLSLKIDSHGEIIADVRLQTELNKQALETVRKELDDVWREIGKLRDRRDSDDRLKRDQLKRELEEEGRRRSREGDAG